MARAATRSGKTETLTIRLDPKTRFVLEYLSRLRGQTITTIVERAIVSAATEAPLRICEDGENFGWQDLWDVSEGVRALRIAGEPSLFPGYEEERRLAFVREHWLFFYTCHNCTGVDRSRVDVLWPRIDEFVEIHEERKADDFFAAGKAMQEVLEAAKLTAPAWPHRGGPLPHIDDKIDF